MYLIELYKNSIRTPVAVSKNVKLAYSFSTFIGEIAEPNQSYKLAVRQLKTEGQALVWDRSRYDVVDLALEAGNFVSIRPIKILEK